MCDSHKGMRNPAGKEIMTMLSVIVIHINQVALNDQHRFGATLLY